jgi:hypothetical protein
MRAVQRIGALALVLLAACGVWDTVKDLVKLSASVSKEFGGQADINIADAGRLTVKLKNSDAAKLPDAERENYARQVAEFIVTHYAKADSLSTIAVAFETQRGALGVTVSTSSGPYVWKVPELRASADSARAHPDSAKTP